MLADDYIGCNSSSALNRSVNLASSICAALCQEDRDYFVGATQYESKLTGWLSELSLHSEPEVCVCLSRTIQVPNASPNFDLVGMYIYPEAYIQGSSMSVMLLDQWGRYSRKYFETVLGYQYLPSATNEDFRVGYYLNEAEMQRVAAIKDHLDRFMAFIHLIKRFSMDVTEYFRDCCKGIPSKPIWDMLKERNIDKS